MKNPRILGSLLGTAVGDALGLPYEGLSRRRAKRILGPPDRYRFLFGRGMVSDDTEHTCMVAQALLASGGDVDSFYRSLGWRFRFWFLGLPAGIGMATVRAILRLWVGIPPQRSGVFSAGNGPAMRAAILGVAVDDRSVLRDLVRASSRITHPDPKAEYGAFAVALAAHLAHAGPTVSPEEFLRHLRASFENDPESEAFLALLSAAAASANERQSTEAFADSLGLSRGVSGYVCHSVPIAIHAWFTHPRDYRAAVTSVIQCGGDTDSTAAMVGGIVGAAVGREGIPADWLKNLIEWPRSVAWMERLAERLDSCSRPMSKSRPVPLSVWALPARNLLFLLVVLVHGFRRLLPPY